MTGRLESRLRRLELARGSSEPLVIRIDHVTPDGAVAQTQWVRHSVSRRIVERSDDGENWEILSDRRSMFDVRPGFARQNSGRQSHFWRAKVADGAAGKPKRDT